MARVVEERLLKQLQDLENEHTKYVFFSLVTLVMVAFSRLLTLPCLHIVCQPNAKSFSKVGG